MYYIVTKTLYSNKNVIWDLSDLWLCPACIKRRDVRYEVDDLNVGLARADTVPEAESDSEAGSRPKVKPNLRSTTGATKSGKASCSQQPSTSDGRQPGREDETSHEHNTKDACVGDSQVGPGGVIIDNILCFLSNKMDILTHDVMTKLCCDKYDESEIDKAKRTLFDVCDPNKRGRYIKRKGDSVKFHSLKDILTLLHEANTNTLPKFVSHDLNLPPVDFNHFDVTSVVKEVRGLRADLTFSKQKSEDELCALRAEIYEMREAVKSLETPVIMEPLLSPMSLGTEPHKLVCEGNLISKKNPVEEEKPSTEVKLLGTPPQVQRVNSAVTSPVTISAADSPPWSMIVRSHPKKQNNVGNEQSDRKVNKDNSGDRPKPTGIKPIQSHSGKIIVGTGAQKDCKLKCVGAKLGKLFVTRLRPDTTSEDISDHISSACGIKGHCDKLKTKFDTYASFCVTVNMQYLNKLLNPSIWPENVLVRKFFKPK